MVRSLGDTSAPSFDGSNHYLQLFMFNAAPVVGERYYFAQNSKIDGARITSMTVHFNNTTFLGSDWDMFRTYLESGITYDVIPFADFTNVFITLESNVANQSIQRIPAGTFYTVASGVPSLGSASRAKARKALDLKISTIRSYIEFSAVPAVRAPFLVPISFYYETPGE